MSMRMSMRMSMSMSRAQRNILIMPCNVQALLHSSHMYHAAKADFANHGVMVDNVQIDLKKMMAQKDKAVTGLTKGVEGLFKKNKVSAHAHGAVNLVPARQPGALVSRQHVGSACVHVTSQAAWRLGAWTQGVGLSQGRPFHADPPPSHLPHTVRHAGRRCPTSRAMASWRPTARWR